MIFGDESPIIMTDIHHLFVICPVILWDIGHLLLICPPILEDIAHQKVKCPSILWDICLVKVTIVLDYRGQWTPFACQGCAGLPGMRRLARDAQAC